MPQIANSGFFTKTSILITQRHKDTKTQRSLRIMLYVQNFSLLLFLCGFVSLCEILKKRKLVIMLYERYLAQGEANGN